MENKKDEKKRKRTRWRRGGVGREGGKREEKEWEEEEAWNVTSRDHVSTYKACTFSAQIANKNWKNQRQSGWTCPAKRYPTCNTLSFTQPTVLSTEGTKKINQIVYWKENEKALWVAMGTKTEPNKYFPFISENRIHDITTQVSGERFHKSPLSCTEQKWALWSPGAALNLQSAFQKNPSVLSKQ